MLFVYIVSPTLGGLRAMFVAVILAMLGSEILTEGNLEGRMY